jgi:hypothetical protein
MPENRRILLPSALTIPELRSLLKPHTRRMELWGGKKKQEQPSEIRDKTGSGKM